MGRGWRFFRRQVNEAYVDAQLERAIASGAELVRAVEDQPYGDRVGAVSDPAGNQWWIATRKETLTSEEIAERISESGGE